MTKFTCFGIGIIAMTIGVYVYKGSADARCDKTHDEIPAPEGYTLVWHDEFGGNSVSEKLWSFEDWPSRMVNNELQRYVAGGVLDGVRTAFVKDGMLNIMALSHNGEVISARMNSRASWKYGYFEARIKLPKGKGTWPAFWMMPDKPTVGWPDCGEIDIMEEIGANPDYTSSTIHCEDFNHVKKTQKSKDRYTDNAEEQFHIYALEWSESQIKTYVDGTPLLIYDNDGSGKTSTWPFDKNFYIILNLAWGGDWGGCLGVDDSALPATMQVDYVRVFARE